MRSEHTKHTLGRPRRSLFLASDGFVLARLFLWFATSLFPISPGLEAWGWQT
jgi:hypothetical protein